jgi:ketosteroid isomerase-like protein
VDPGTPDQHDAVNGAVVADVLETAAAWAEAIVANDASRIADFVTEEWVIVSESGISP